MTCDNCENYKEKAAPAQPAPETAEAQLRAAGARSVTQVTGIDNSDTWAQIHDQDDLVTLFIHKLPLPRAVAALKASRGKWPYDVDKSEEAYAHLAARDEEVKRLKGIIAHNNQEYSAVLAKVRDENWTLARNKES